jgi:hypothetical protein
MRKAARCEMGEECPISEVCDSLRGSEFGAFSCVVEGKL